MLRRIYTEPPFVHTCARLTPPPPGLEKERDFYFDKLRDVEVLLQAHQEKSGGNDPLIDNVFKVLYATSDDKISVTDNGELVGGKQEKEMEEVEAAPPIMMEGGEAVLA